MEEKSAIGRVTFITRFTLEMKDGPTTKKQNGKQSIGQTATYYANIKVT